jgi:hypothetical protein
MGLGGIVQNLRHQRHNQQALKLARASLSRQPLVHPREGSKLNTLLMCHSVLSSEYVSM